ncbi:hypothetical protein T492DRAFT_1027256 [Pavlovales sp. CCMP2436]|nr:hypothetical protein T492DRAFT_1027256 [Pavlovales sp. CCMP2436]
MRYRAAHPPSLDTRTRSPRDHAKLMLAHARYLVLRQPHVPVAQPAPHRQRSLVGLLTFSPPSLSPWRGNPREAADSLGGGLGGKAFAHQRAHSPSAESSRAASDAYAKGPASVRSVQAGVLERRGGTAREHLRSITRRPARAQALAAHKAGRAAKQQAAVCTQHGARLFVPRRPRTSAWARCADA